MHSIHEMVLFQGFWGPNSPKFCLILLKFFPDVILKKTKPVFENFLKNSKFYGNRVYPKFALFSVCATVTHFFTLKEAKIEKTKYF